MEKYKAIDIARWFINRNLDDVNKGEDILFYGKSKGKTMNSKQKRKKNRIENNILPDSDETFAYIAGTFQVG